MFRNGWYYMPDKGDGSGNGAEVEETPAEAKKPESPMIPKERFDEVNSRMKEYEKKLQAQEKALKEAQEARLKEKEDYKQLYEQTTAELSELKPLAEQVETYKETMESLFESQVADIPEEMRSLIPDELSVKQKLDWIARNKNLLLKPVAPNIGAGNRGSGASPKTRELTPDEKQVAETFGYTAEEYLKYVDEA